MFRPIVCVRVDVIVGFLNSLDCYVLIVRSFQGIYRMSLFLGLCRA